MYSRWRLPLVRPRPPLRLHSTLPVYSPRDGSLVGHIEDSSAQAVDQALASARECLSSQWSRVDSCELRAEALRGMARELRERHEELSRLESTDCGRPITETRADLSFSVEVCEYFASLGPRVLLREEELQSDAPFSSRSKPHPAGVVGCVTPWNYPLMQAVAKVAPAIAAGCTVLLKPSPLASLTCIELCRIASRNGLPRGALTLITGGPPAGKADGASRLIAHPSLDMLSFTGSRRGGAELLHASAERVRRTSLELGGKGALIVFDDADIAAAVDWAMVGIFCASGQICSATSR